MSEGGRRGKETKMCSEQTCLSRFVIEGHQGSKQPVCVCVCVYSTVRAAESVCASLYTTVCNECVRALNYHPDCSLGNKYCL